MTSQETAEKAIEILADKKAIDIKSYDIRDKPGAFADFAIVATANSQPHLKALAGAAQSEMRKIGGGLSRISGDSESAWIVVDFGDVMAHIFLSNAREYYEIERLWIKG
jgi:iojap-like ribosome-associated protein